MLESFVTMAILLSLSEGDAFIKSTAAINGQVGCGYCGFLCNFVLFLFVFLKQNER